MADILIRGLSDTAITRIDTEAAAHGLSRNEYLRRRFEAERSDDGARLTVADLQRAAEAAQDLDDPDVMEAAWR
ncbi:hypothetical protein [Mycolicibacter kumamotonensis]|jgi:hypothetical protein|uniref:Antitoxin n=1 Tax=Mycolicibacter kumamotonensis TaxID=354243 RepID=A0A1B8S8A8_9MYCO|nr:hypothetical protein [Mycolicibacter kumamotonensis]OBY28978.1 hypothetical protein ACT18_25585 [Mycolicibacter kumamotonensis]